VSLAAHTPLLVSDLPPAFVRLGDEAHVWLASRAALAGEGPALPPHELARCAAIADPIAQDEFVAGRCLLRRTLAHYTGLPALQHVFGQEERGKPYLEHPIWRHRLQFNLTHAGGLVACAVVAGGREVRVGIDVERCDRPVDADALCTRFFAPHEAAFLARLPADERNREFFALWTLKEAFLKARGCGLVTPLSDVVFDTAASVPMLLAPRAPSRQWTFALHRHSEYALALAVEAPSGRRFTVRHQHL
jgi:4'-phosphopantetheinyl transferase